MSFTVLLFLTLAARRLEVPLLPPSENRARSEALRRDGRNPRRTGINIDSSDAATQRARTASAGVPPVAHAA
jgi:hypothetical protein